MTDSLYSQVGSQNCIILVRHPRFRFNNTPLWRAPDPSERPPAPGWVFQNGRRVHRHGFKHATDSKTSAVCF